MYNISLFLNKKMNEFELLQAYSIYVNIFNLDGLIIHKG